MKNNTKTKIVALMIAGLGLSSAAQAQWATINVGDVLNRAIQQAGFNTMSAQNAANNVALQQIMKQQVANQDDSQKRNLFNGQIQNLQQKTGANVPQPPSLQQCIALSANLQKSAAVAASGGGGGGSSNPKHPDNKLDKAPPALQDIQNDTLKSKTELGTCTANDAGTGGCGTGSAAPYKAGDYHPRALLGNIQNVPLATDGSMYNNYTLDTKQLQVASQNIQNAALYGNPIGLSEQENKNNPSYNAEATLIRGKLAAASEALFSVLRMKIQPPAGSAPSASTPAGKAWANANGNYTTLTGNKIYPSNPSLYDMVNYQVLNQYAGNDTTPPSIEEINNKLVLNNFLLWKLYQQQEQMIILQSHQLAQSVAPVSTGATYKLGRNAKNAESK